MSCFGHKKPLLPAKKAWRRFSAALQSKLHKLRGSKPIAAFLPGPCRSPYGVRRRRGRSALHARKLSHRRSFAPVYVDELFSQPVAVHVEPPAGAEGVKAEGKSARSDAAIAVGSTSSSSSSGSSSGAIGELGGVDMRAEMFIAKFREEMRLQRQRSFGEYQDMLARGV